MGGVDADTAREAMRLAAFKLAIKTRFLALQEATGHGEAE